MKRRVFLIGTGLLTCGSMLGTAATPAKAIGQEPEPWAGKLIAAAENQIGITLTYDPAYVGLAFPNGDIPRERGVCTDVVIRAYRDAFGFDLQRAVNRDMKAHFSRYPKIWGLKGPDRNIDHRRVPNLQTFFRRKGAALPVSDRAGDYVPGDIVSQMLPGNLPHIAIVTHRMSADGERPMLVHNIGAGTRLEDRLFDFEITGRYRFKPA
ncbi:DUF1287 domain-containing protein [Roseibium sp. Sym1]|uniref:DUF1287 domain-containing protein n=1 Tax=Roseibium sp. Sym1 TaxID=3016006 RepID=UPI0022B4B503|nr:DUF1287 domain-containing protein [Roseibium sp. Sym1]